MASRLGNRAGGRTNSKTFRGPAQWEPAEKHLQFHQRDLMQALRDLEEATRAKDSRLKALANKDIKAAKANLAKWTEGRIAA